MGSRSWHADLVTYTTKRIRPIQGKNNAHSINCSQKTVEHLSSVGRRRVLQVSVLILGAVLIEGVLHKHSKMFRAVLTLACAWLDPMRFPICPSLPTGMTNFGYNRPESAHGEDQGQQFEPYATGGMGATNSHHRVPSSIFGNTTGSKTSVVG